MLVEQGGRGRGRQRQPSPLCLSPPAANETHSRRHNNHRGAPRALEEMPIDANVLGRAKADVSRAASLEAQVEQLKLTNSALEKQLQVEKKLKEKAEAAQNKAIQRFQTSQDEKHMLEQTNDRLDATINLLRAELRLAYRNKVAPRQTNAKGLTVDGDLATVLARRGTQKATMSGKNVWKRRQGAADSAARHIEGKDGEDEDDDDVEDENDDDDDDDGAAPETFVFAAEAGLFGCIKCGKAQFKTKVGAVSHAMYCLAPSPSKKSTAARSSGNKSPAPPPPPPPPPEVPANGRAVRASTRKGTSAILAQQPAKPSSVTSGASGSTRTRTTAGAGASTSAAGSSSSHAALGSGRAARAQKRALSHDEPESIAEAISARARGVEPVPLAKQKKRRSSAGAVDYNEKNPRGPYAALSYVMRPSLSPAAPPSGKRKAAAPQPLSGGDDDASDDDASEDQVAPFKCRKCGRADFAKKGAARSHERFCRGSSIAPSPAKTGGAGPSSSAAASGDQARVKWTDEETEELRRGFAKHGRNWVLILEEGEGIFHPSRDNIKLKDRARNIELIA